MDWQPIDTAPKDGTKLLLARYVGNPLHDSALWWMAAGAWSEKYQNWNDTNTPDAFVCPTHWMPLPEPPK